MSVFLIQHYQRNESGILFAPNVTKGVEYGLEEQTITWPSYVSIRGVSL